VLQLVATIRHCTGGLIELLTRIAAFLLLNLSYYSARSFPSFQRLLLLFQYALWHPFHNFRWRKCSYQDSKIRWPDQRPFLLSGYLICHSKQALVVITLHLSGFMNNPTLQASSCRTEVVSCILASHQWVWYHLLNLYHTSVRLLSTWCHLHFFLCSSWVPSLSLLQTAVAIGCNLVEHLLSPGISCSCPCRLWPHCCSPHKASK